MAMVSSDIWADELTVALPGATKQAIQQAFRATFREFCNQSGAWARELPLVDIVAGQDTYSLASQVSDATILYILGAYLRMVNGEDVHHRALAALQTPFHRDRSTSTSGLPRGFYGNTEAPATIVLTPTPKESMAGGLLVYVALGPKYPYEDEVPDFLRSHAYDVLLDGTLGRMMGQQDKPYTNTIGAQYYLRRFRTGIAQQRDMARRQYTSTESSFLFPPWAG
jgi:hypothetical protein